MQATGQARIYSLLKVIPENGIKAVKELICTALNYPRAYQELPTQDWTEESKKVIKQGPMLLAGQEGEGESFDVIYIKLAEPTKKRRLPLSVAAERAVIAQLVKHHPYALYLFSTRDESHWHFINVRGGGGGEKVGEGADRRARAVSRPPVLRRISVGPGHGLETAAERISLLNLAHLQDTRVDISPLEIQRQHERAFDVKALRENFFQGYIRVFNTLQDDFYRQTRDRRCAQEHALRALGRNMFAHFVDRTPPDGFRHDLQTAQRLEKVLEFFEGYHYTLREDTPLDQEVAVDPEMIGKVYESLVNVTEEGNQRGERGVFYTSRVEIDLMSRLSVVDWLSNHLGEERKNLLYQAVFAFDADHKKQADQALSEKELWPKINALLRNLKVIDPACGSGSFLMGMLHVVDDLLQRAGDQLGREESALARKKHIIENTLYGVDVMDGAAQVAEQRLRLQLLAEADVGADKPVSISFSSNIRPGDSLLLRNEILEDDHEGFDIVIGNPPYVRQENIHDPSQLADNLTAASKKAYKEKLRQSVYAAWPASFGYDKQKEKNTRNTIGLRSDLYLYFYFHGLSLLNEKGSLCFITSNSWLDVRYGKSLQEFLLTRGKVKMIIDNESHRSFESADVNTIIALLAKPRDQPKSVSESLDHRARFVNLKGPFEHTLSSRIWAEIETANQRRSVAAYRVIPLTQASLVESGLDQAGQKYIGDKWGGKYLRAPEIYWTIMEKAGHKFVRLGDIADVRRGFTTGANAFFYLDEEEVSRWEIEEEFLKPVIKSPRECKTIPIDPAGLQYKLFLCHKDRSALKGTGALAYIKHGEKMGYHQRPTTSSRRRWWDLGKHLPPRALWKKAFDDTFAYLINPANVLASDRFYEINFHEAYTDFQIAAALNNTLNFISTELNGRVSLGEGALDNMTYEAADNLIISPALLPEEGPIISREIHAIPEELKYDDRHLVDNVVFDILELNAEERDAVYAGISHLVNVRLRKAKSTHDFRN
ncbi:MAG: Type IIS restriction enzyme Eco57I [Chloroflexi bacterium]|nr:Type IIS restriction enzyme Eco57I [Chloroflexota bacterium]